MTSSRAVRLFNWMALNPWRLRVWLLVAAPIGISALFLFMVTLVIGRAAVGAWDYGRYELAFKWPQVAELPAIAWYGIRHGKRPAKKNRMPGR